LEASKGVPVSEVCDLCKKNPKENYETLDRITLLYISHVTRYKHQRVVLEAVHRIRREHKLDLRLTLVGEVIDDDKTKFYDTVRRTGADEFLTMRGKVKFSEVSAFYRDADIFIFASSCENCPVTLLEAMSSASVIVCSDTDFNREFAKDAALYFDVGDVDSLARALMTLIRDEGLRKTLARRAYSYAAAFPEKDAGEEGRFFAEVIEGTA